MVAHVELVRELRRTRLSQVRHESFGDYHEIAFCSFDRSRLFADYAGLLFSEGFNVLGARVYSRADGVAIDVFFAEVADGVAIEVESRVDRIRRKLARLDAKEIVIGDITREWVKTHRFRKLRRAVPSVFTPRVTFDNRSSPDCTLIEVLAGDRPGLLYDLASAMSRLALNLRTAKISTMCDHCRDVFYVVEVDGEKVTNPARMKEIEELLEMEATSPSSVLGV
jgi:[protein-PII] uridylyltransferase